MSLITTPSQTVGPYLRIGFGPLASTSWSRQIRQGEQVITIVGRIFDGDGKPVSDAALEIWQANAQRQVRPSRGHAQGQSTGSFAASAAS